MKKMVFMLLLSGISTYCNMNIIDNDEFLKQKSEQKRTIFIQRYFYFAEISDIADRMGMKESSVRSALSRMRKELKNYLEQEGIAI